MSVDWTGLAAGASRAQATLDLTPAAQAFARAPGLVPGLKLIDTAAEVIGLERLTGQVAKYAVKLALRGDRSAVEAAALMVDRMRGRVPVDSGRLLHGIGWSQEGHRLTVEASAVHGAAEYARFVEFGHRNAAVADDGFFAGDAFADDAHPALHARGGASSGETAPEPFFWNSVREGLAQWREGLVDAPARAWDEGGA
ncbi:HK97 gp10 family phage protein [Methylobacterium aerolatum]|uniref:HK97 gp10 family phage protein n=1 Tax=Methylobacterium aerolatum TaxID=418708 RepID=A0ABU0I2M5_9HYPH|nr:HK97 gp10 family phage protein [Methylobacterium aerolatum]MDQ0448852.1 HK97 gp10 family phage protein [Methylobacterium aerolatum]GJD34216.1 hypothetical protein FMGBMHLM_1112 [Methylobacterium aerolatum]